MLNEKAPENPIPQSADEITCPSCSRQHQCRQAWSLSSSGPLSPLGLLLASVLAFLLPIISAITCVVLVQFYWQTRLLAQVIAALGGLAIGGSLAWLLMPFIRKHFPYVPNG